jgi:hypothetical protein
LAPTSFFLGAHFILPWRSFFLGALALDGVYVADGPGGTLAFHALPARSYGVGGEISERSRDVSHLPNQRERPYANAVLVDADQSARAQVGFAQSDDALQERRKLAGAEALDSYAHGRRRRGIRKCEQRMEIGVESHDDASLTARVLDELMVGRRSHADIARMDRVIAEPDQFTGGTAGQTLIQQELHALFGSSSTLSSRAAAA